MSINKILIVSTCGKRRNTIGLIGVLLDSLKKIDKSKYSISLLDTNFYERNHNPRDYDVDNYYGLEIKWYDSLIRLIPRLRALYAKHIAIKSFRDLMYKHKFNVVVVYQVPPYADSMVKIAHQFGSKIVFEPFGSDVLRVNEKVKTKLKGAFAGVDGVVGRTKSNVLIAAKEVYNVPNSRIFEQKEVQEGVIRLKALRGKLSREAMHNEVGIPCSNYNIVCGYSGRESHRHKKIIDSLIQVKDVLPDGYQIIFPMTYGAGEHHEIIIEYARQLEAECDKAGLNSIFLTDFMSFEQLTYLHLITDLFVEIQPTDNGNAFMIEALYAKNQIVTGRWLNYKRFEQFGEPYYLIDKPEDLSDMLRKIFTQQVEKVNVPQALVDFFDVPEEYDRSLFWAKLFDRILPEK